MGLFDKNQYKNTGSGGDTTRETTRHGDRFSKNSGKTIYNQQTNFEWNSTYVKDHSLQSRRIQTNGLDPDALGDTVSLIKLEEDTVMQPGYNPYDSGLSAMKQSRKPSDLQDLSKHNTHLRKYGKHE